MKKHFAMLRRPLSFILAVLMVLSCVNGAVFTASAAETSGSVAVKEILLNYVNGEAERKIIADYVNLDDSVDYSANDELFAKRVTVTEDETNYVITAKSQQDNMGNEWNPVAVSITGESGNPISLELTEVEDGTVTASVNKTEIGKSYNVAVTYGMFVTPSDKLNAELAEILALPAALKADYDALAPLSSAQSDLNALIAGVEIEGLGEVVPLKVIRDIANDNFSVEGEYTYEGETYDVSLRVYMTDENANAAAEGLWGEYDEAGTLNALSFIDKGTLVGKFNPIYALAENGSAVENLVLTYEYLTAIEAGLSKLDALKIVQDAVNETVADLKPDLVEEVNTEALKKLNEEIEKAPAEWGIEPFESKEAFEKFLLTADKDLKAKVDETALKELNEAIADAPEALDLPVFTSKAQFDEFVATSGAYLAGKVDEIVADEMATAMAGAPEGISLSFATQAELEAYLANAEADLKDQIDTKVLEEINDAVVEANGKITVEGIVIPTFEDKDHFDNYLETAEADLTAQVNTNALAALNEAVADAGYDQEFTSKDEVEMAVANPMVPQALKDAMEAPLADWNVTLTEIQNACADMEEVQTEWENAYDEIPGVIEKLTDANQAWKDALADAEAANEDLAQAAADWTDAYAEVESKVADMNNALGEWNDALDEIYNANAPTIDKDHEAVTKVQTMLDQLIGIVESSYTNLEAAAKKDEWALLEQDVIADDADMGILNDLVAKVASEQDALPETLESGKTFVYNYAVATSTVTVKAVFENVYDKDGSELTVESESFFKYYSQDDAPATASVEAEIEKEFEKNYLDLLAEAYGIVDAENYNIEWTWATEPGVKLEDSNTYTLNVSAKEYTVTEKWEDGEEAKLFYGQVYEGMVEHTDAKYEYIYTDGTNSYYQGEKFQVEGDVTVERTRFAKATNMTLPQIIVAAKLVENEAAQKILGSAALISDSFRIRFPNTAATKSNSLVKVNGEEVITEQFESGLGDTVWSAASGILTFEDNTNETIGLTNGANEITKVYKQLEAVYALDVSGEMDAAAVEAMLNLPMNLIADYNINEKELAEQTTQKRIDNLNMIGNALPFIKNNLPEGSVAIGAYAEIEAHLYGGKIPMVTHLNEIANLRNAGKEAAAMAYYYKNAESLINSMKVVTKNVPIMIADESIQTMLKDNGYSLDDINTYLTSVEETIENFKPLNALVNVNSTALQSLMEIVAENKDVKLEAVEAPASMILTAKLAPVAGPGHKEIFITVGNVSGGITVQDGAATLGEDNANLINDLIEDLKKQDKGTDVEFYDFETFEITADTKIDVLVEMNDYEGLILGSSAKEFEVEVPGSGTQTLTIENTEIKLAQHEVDGFFYTYYVWDANGKVVAEYEVRNGEVVARALPLLSETLEVDDFKALVKGGKITREETDIVSLELNTFASKVDGATLIENGDKYAYVIPMGTSKEGTSVVMDFVTSLIMENVGYNQIMLDANYDGAYGEGETFYDGANGMIHLQPMVDAFLNSGIHSDELAARIQNKTDLASELSYGSLLGVKVLEVPMQLLGGKYPAEAMLYITLDEISDQVMSAVNGYNALSSYAKAIMDNGEVHLSVTMPENYPIYEAYMALMMMEEASYTDSITGETIHASWDNIDQMNGALAFNYLIEDVIGTIVLDENVTVDTYDNTIDILNTIAGKVTDKQLPNLPETIYALGNEYSVEELYEKFAYGYANKNLIYDNDEVYKEGYAPIQRLVGMMGLGSMSKNIAEYDTGLKVKVVAEITNANTDYQALMVELRAEGISNKVHMTENVAADAANMAGAGAIMLLDDVDELVLNSKTVLDLNGNHVNSIVANGFVAILDSSLGNGSVGTVSGNAHVMGGHYAQADIEQYLAAGYGVENGEVYNKLYSITNVGDELNIKVHVNKDNMKEFVNIEGAVKLVMEIVSDVAFNYYRSASLYFDIDGEECMLYDFSLDNVLGTAASANRTNILSLIIDTMIGDESKGIPGWINEPQYAKIVNEIVDQMTDFQNMDITGETPFFAMDASFAKFDIEYGHVEHADYEDGYLDFSIGSDNTKDLINKKVNFFLDIDSSIADSLLSFLADIVYVNDLELTLDHIDYNDAGDFTTNGSYGGNVTIDINVREEEDDIRYMNTIMAILANNSAKQDKWVIAINSNDYLCLYNLFNQVTIEEMLEAIAAVGSIDADILDGLYADLKAVGKADKQILIDMYNIALDSVTLDREAINELYEMTKDAAPENVAAIKALLKALTESSEAVKALADDLKAVYATDKEVAKKLVEVIRVCVNIDRAQVKSFGAEVKAVAADNLDALKACYNAFRYGRTSNLAEMAEGLGITEPVENRFNIFAEALSYAMKAALKVADHYGFDPAFLQRTMGSFEGAKGVYDIRSTRTVDADVSIRGFSLTSSFSTDDLALVLDLFPADLGDHIWGEAKPENVVGATCTTKGSYDMVIRCLVCDVIKSSVHVDNDYAPHTPAAAVKENEVAATCTTKGSYDLVVYCSVCDHEISRETIAVDMLAHVPAAAVKENEVAATCTTKGSYDEVVYCSVCGTEISRNTVVIDEIAHTPAAAVKENEVAADCVNNGSYDEVVYCSVCGTEISRVTKTVPATGHAPAAAVKENEVAATCTTKGSYDEVVYCSVCGTELSRNTVVVDEIAHTPAAPVKENEVPATCTTKGSYDEVVYCSVCGTELSREAKTVDALGHDWGEWKSISDTEHQRVCKRDASHVETEAHVWGNDNICDICGHEKKVDDEHVHVAGEVKIENVVKATCTTDGKHDEVVYCSVCGEEMSRKTIIDKATGHKEGDWVVLQESNCFVQGLKGIKCVNCGEVLKSEKLPFGYHKHICSHTAENCDSLKAGLTDVSMKEWYHDHIDCIVYRGIMIGMTETTFEPQTTTTRAMVVQMLYRMECDRQGVEEGELKYNYTGKLKDLTGNEWYAEAAKWAYANDVLEGILYADGTIGFEGDTAVTREQLVAFLYRYVGEFRGVNTDKLADISGYPDAKSVAQWAYTAMRWAVGNGIIEGQGRSVKNPSDTPILDPISNATRAEIATVFHRMLELVIEPAESGK